jgi:ubiquitin-activating enzyme E1
MYNNTFYNHYTYKKLINFKFIIICLKLMSQTFTQIDNNLYDRQIRTYGVEAMKKMSSSSVLIYGLEKGLGTEVAKNLTLGGVRNIYLYDENPVISSDLETGIYYSTDSIGLIRSQVLVTKLKELNPYVNIQAVNNFKQKQNVTIVINQSTETVSNVISNYCREISSKLVVLYSRGISGVIFVDAGQSHTVTDVTGENIEPVQIGEIYSDGKVKCASNSSHDFQSGDTIKFNNLEGTNLEQFNKEWKINVINTTTFQLEQFDNISKYSFINGTAIHIKKPIEIYHQTWEQQLENPTVSFSFDMDNAKKLVDTYIQMFTNNLVYSIPFIWSESNNDFMQTNKILLCEHARTFAYEIIPVVSLMGSITASEAIKLITNKYMPANQWFTWSDSELIPKTQPKYKDAKTSYGILWGTEFETKLFNSKWFMVGSGAIGCEYLKNLAYMNIANTKLGTGEIIITDPDSIEKSNLNRQFLFRSHHIGKSKSEMATSVIKQMKPHINIRSFSQKVGSDSMEFTNQIMDSNITGVLNALDNVKARRFMDEMCFKYNIPLFESGTTGTKGNTQPVIPFVTETYSNSTDPEQEKSFPICTIKSFPNEITHTIHWAMDQFEFFNRAPSTINKWIENSEYINELSQVEKSIVMSDINKLTIKYPTQKTGLKGCAEWAVDMFTENYYNSIVQLLHTFAPEHEVIPGVKFWSAGKRCPKPIKFDSENKDHFNYVNATTHIIARISGINDNFTNEQLKEIITKYQPTVFIPTKIKIATTDSELEKIFSTQNQDILIGTPTEFTQTFVPQEFEKDNDSNWHIDWITAASNIRAMNYNIPIADRQQTKGIAGRIIPAIATTTSAISGLTLMEMLKYLIGFNKVEQYRSTFINIAEPVLIYSEPIEAPMIKINGIKLNSWTKFEYTKDSTVGEFKKFYDTQFKINISMIVIGTSMIYAEFISSDSIHNKLSDAIKQALDIDYVPSNVSVSLATDDDCELPLITINLK